MSRRQFLSYFPKFFFGLSILPEKIFSELLPFSEPKVDFPTSLQRITFGSCAQQWLPQPIWNQISIQEPGLFIFLGDNIYGDTQDMKIMAKKYHRLGSKPEFIDFRNNIPIIATWDDHDFGENDVGEEYPCKADTKKLMLDFFNEPTLSERRQREGVYTSYCFGDSPQRVQVILLDLRWFRTPLFVDREGKYGPNPDPAATMLGAEQWTWLENELRQPADVRIIGSSIQFVSSEHRWEKWANFPQEMDRMYRLMDELDLYNTFFISGDMHFAELSKGKTPGGRDVYDLTSSGLTRFETLNLPNSQRVALFDTDANFGMMTIDWDKQKIRLEACDSQSNIVISHSVDLQRVQETSEKSRGPEQKGRPSET